MNLIILIPLQKFIFVKKVFLVILFFALTGCKSNHINTSLKNLEETFVVDIKNCVDNAQCNLEIIPNSHLIIKQDEFKNSYIELEKRTNTVIKYQLDKRKVPNTADSNYTELLYIEIDNYNKTLILKDEELQRVKMIYGRLCFCKGSSGYFKVKKGHLELILKKNHLTLSANFSVENIPQITTQIHEIITL